jgi:hypothetical protein
VVSEGWCGRMLIIGMRDADCYYFIAVTITRHPSLGRVQRCAGFELLSIGVDLCCSLATAEVEQAECRHRILRSP